MKETTIKTKYNEKNLDISANINEGEKEWILCLHGLQSNKQLFDNLLSRPFYQDLFSINILYW